MRSHFLQLALIVLSVILLLPSCEEPEPSGIIPDPSFEAVIREALDMPTGDITPEDLLAITEIEVEWGCLTDITGIEYCTNLTDLDLSGNQIVDISPLSGLTNLIDLDLRGNQIVDIPPLSGLTNLTDLDLWDNQIVDISPLSGLTSLTELSLSFNQILEISPFFGLTSLTKLLLYDNQIVDISPIVQNPGIDQGDLVDLRSNPLSDISINTYIPQLWARGVNVFWY